MATNIDKDRFYSRLSTIPGVQLMPSIGDWILMKVEQPVPAHAAGSGVPALTSAPVDQTAGTHG